MTKHELLRHWVPAVLLCCAMVTAPLATNLQIDSTTRHTASLIALLFTVGATKLMVGKEKEPR